MSQFLRHSGETSFKGFIELYLILVGIAITSILDAIPQVGCEWSYFGFIIFLVGYMATLLRFSLATFIMLDFIGSVHKEDRTVRDIGIAILFIFCGIAFFLMGKNSADIHQFLIYTISLLVLDQAIIFLNLQPWKKGGVFYLIKKSLSILTWYFILPTYNPQRLEGATESKIMIKRTQYQWIRNNFWLMLILLYFAITWQETPRVCPVTHVLYPETIYLALKKQHLWVSQTGVGVILLGFSILDFLSNFKFFFGANREAALESFADSSANG